MRLDKAIGYYAFLVAVMLGILAVSFWFSNMFGALVGVLLGWVLFGQAGNKWVDDIKVKSLFWPKYPPQVPSPTGSAARAVRLRLAVFGVLTSAAFLLGLAMYLGKPITSPSILLFLGALVFAGYASLSSCTALMLTLGVFRGLTEPVFVIADLAGAALRKGEARKQAFQRVYGAEWRLFSQVAGYQSMFTFRSDNLREDIPKIGGRV